jgi:YD repeat-containing protein
MRAYKASYSGKCKKITYEVGKTYTFKGQIKMCCDGFHFCINPQDVLTYYPYNKDLVIFEIEVDGNYITQGDKSVTNSFKIIRKITEDEYPTLLDIQVDSKGNLIWQKDRGYECHYKYDSDGNRIWSKDSCGCEWSYEYDSNGNLIWKRSSDFEWNFKYDSKGNLIWRKDYSGNEVSYEYQYDLKGNKIWFKDSRGIEYSYKHDSKGNLISEKNSSYGNEENYKYDSKGNLIWKKNSSGEWNAKYDSNNNIIWEQYSNCLEYNYKYDSKGNLIWCKKSNGVEWSIEIK